MRKEIHHLIWIQLQYLQYMCLACMWRCVTPALTGSENRENNNGLCYYTKVELAVAHQVAKLAFSWPYVLIL